MKKGIVLAMSFCAILLAGSALAAEGDAPGCADHPLFSRMPSYLIQRCETRAFDQHGFLDAKRAEVKVEGKLYEIRYARTPGSAEVTRLQIQRNYQNAVAKIGGTHLATDDDGNSYLRLAKDGKELWVHVAAYIPDEWMLTIVEREAMKQDVVADAAALAGGIRSEGHVAVYGILFDTGKAELKPASEPALAEVAKLLKADAGLRLRVVGHTDNVGDFDANLKLSQARAAAVVAALVGKHGIAATRLQAHGVGSLAPLASNDNEAGRAKNRRVELVK